MAHAGHPNLERDPRDADRIPATLHRRAQVAGITNDEIDPIERLLERLIRQRRYDAGCDVTLGVGARQRCALRLSPLAVRVDPGVYRHLDAPGGDVITGR